jgi:hypothetical protein
MQPWLVSLSTRQWQRDRCQAQAKSSRTLPGLFGVFCHAFHFRLQLVSRNRPLAVIQRLGVAQILFELFLFKLGRETSPQRVTASDQVALRPDAMAAVKRFSIARRWVGHEADSAKQKEPRMAFVASSLARSKRIQEVHLSALDFPPPSMSLYSDLGFGKIAGGGVTFLRV